jgi:AcrR family transcriptional regulator
LNKTIKNKELIIRQAFKLFLQKGYKSVSINDIMNDTNLSKGAIYHHFESKEKILFAALDEYYFDDLAFDKSLFANCSFREQIKKLYWIGLELYDKTEHIDENNNIDYAIKNFFNFQLECENFDLIREKFKQITIGYRKVVEELVVDAINNKEVIEGLDAESISFQIIGIIEGMAIHHSTIKNNVKEIMAEKFKKVFDSYLDLICVDEK